MPNSNEQIYPYTFIYQSRICILLWATSINADYFKTDDNNILYQASSIQDAKKEFINLPFDINWSDAGAEIDFDVFWNQLKQLDTENATNEKVCEVLLNGWNFIEDILRTYSLNALREKLDDPQINKSYKKLYYGNNIEAVTPKDASYSPLWNFDELSLFRGALLDVWNGIGEKTNLWKG